MITKYRDIFYIFDKPVPYGKLFFHPVRMQDYIEFFSFSDCLTIDKNSISDIKDIENITMSYLEYMMKYDDSKNVLLGKLDRILRIVLNDKDNSLIIRYYKKTNENKALIIVDDVEIDSDMFDEIKTIICEQNMVELEDYTISKEVRDALREARNFKNKGGNKMGGLEDQILCLVSSTSMKVEDISNLTVRKFIKLLQRVDNKLHYEIYLAASMSGMVEFKDKSFIKHWMSDLDDKKGLDENLISKESVENKLSGKKQ